MSQPQEDELPTTPLLRAQIVISLNAEGEIHVAAPIEDLMTCLALLELGKDAIKAAALAHQQQQKRSPLVPIHGLIPLNGHG